MNQTIKRESYLQRIIERKGNGLVKVITGIRRCGRSDREKQDMDLF